jgi:D-glycero-D-manno-heptose 1,7-bisphosphate phosphatase
MLRAREAGFKLVGLSNQSGIGRGYYTESDFFAVQKRVDSLLSERGIGFDAFFYCPHEPQAACSCRKPEPGLLHEAGRLFGWKAERSWLVGDKVADVQLAVSAGLGAVLVLTGQGSRELSRLPAGMEIHVADDLTAAVSFILTGDAA